MKGITAAQAKANAEKAQTKFAFHIELINSKIEKQSKVGKNLTYYDAFRLNKNEQVKVIADLKVRGFKATMAGNEQIQISW